MNYSTIVYNAFTAEGKFVSDYFISECKKAERDEFITPEMFFAGCLSVCKGLKTEIKKTFYNWETKCKQYDEQGNELPFNIDEISYPFGDLQVDNNHIDFIIEMIEIAKIELIDLPDAIKKMAEKIESKETPPPPAKLTTTLNQVRMKAIHQWLKENNYIDVDVDSWLFWFDLQTWISKKKKPAKIKWIDAVYHLTNVVYLLCGNMNKQTEKAMKDAFQLPNGSKFQKVTKENIQRDKEPYKSLYNMIKFADRNIKNLN